MELTHIKTSLDLIHNNFKINEGLDVYSKQDILRYVQAYKNILKNSENICVIDNIGVQSIAALFAAMELNIAVHAVSNISDSIARITSRKTIDTVVCNKQYAKYCDPSVTVILTDVLPSEEYFPDEFDYSVPVFHNYTSGTTGKPKEIIHTCCTVISASILASRLYSDSDRFLISQNYNHAGVISMGVLGPILAGVTMFLSRNSIVDVIFYCCYKCINKFLLFPPLIADIHDVSYNFNIFKDGMLNGITVITGGSTIVPSVVDWCFVHGAKHIINVYGATECLPPIGINVINDRHYDLTTPTIGSIVGEYLTTVSDGKLCVNGPGVSEYVATSDGFYDTGDYVTYEANQYNLNGRYAGINLSKLTVQVDSIISTIKAFPIGKYAITYTNNEIQLKLDNNWFTDVQQANIVDQVSKLGVVVSKITPNENGLKVN